MSPYRRNLLVGITVLAALGILGWMLIQFGGAVASPFAPRLIRILLTAERADGLAEGSAVFFRGVQVGQVRSVYRTEEDPLHVQIEAEVEPSPAIPANVQGVIRIPSALGGGAIVDLELPENDDARGQLERGTRITASHAGTGFLPPEFGELARELRDTTRQFRESNLVHDIDQQVQKIGQIVEDIRDITGDPKVREDLKAGIANIRATTEKADRLAGRLEELSDQASKTLEGAQGAIGRTETEIATLSRQFGEQLTHVGQLLDQFQAITARIEKGQGTAGKLVHDDRLYESLVITVQQMQATVSDLQRLIRQWEQEGVYLRLR